MKNIYSPALKGRKKPAGAAAYDGHDEDCELAADPPEQSDWMTAIRNLSEEVRDPWHE